jgi:hypothetical protein
VVITGKFIWLSSYFSLPWSDIQNEKLEL